MRKIIFAILIITAISFKLNNEKAFDIKVVTKEFIKIKNDLFVCKYEVSNAEYRNFITELINSNQKETYNICLPDTLCWRDATTYNEPYVEYYFRYPNFNDYPVVGISYEAANEYCKWLTKKYNEDPKRKFDEVMFKLLNKDEWIFAANKGDNSRDYTWGSGFMQNNRKQWLCNFRHTTFVFDSISKKYNELHLDGKSIIAGPVKNFYPNSFGLYNMCGNVAEMIEEKGVAKGGSYNDPAYMVKISSEKKYAKPQADIGFRVAMKVIRD